jgi:hypothetical protein
MVPGEIQEMIANRKPFLAYAFEYACALNDIDHRLTKPKRRRAERGAQALPRRSAG